VAIDRSTYTFNGKTYGKGRLVLAVVEQYVSDNPRLAKAKLEEIFPATLQGSIGVLSSIEEAEGKYKGKRHFVKSAIKLANATIAVCNQWGSGNIDMFLQHAIGELGYAVENDSGAEDELSGPSDVFDMAMIVNKINIELSRIIFESTDEFNSSEQAKVRPGYGPDKFYLDKIDGAYDSSLQSLIHNILWEKKLYHKFLTKRQLMDVERVIKEEPGSIYKPDLDDESTSEEEFEQDEALDESLDALYWRVITYVGGELSEFDFFDNSEFEDNGYVESNDD
jgi:hypothetical protein|tara:strand:+ start:50 stop:889 length:840 start_codon:yes stop_codon:yes gene_type:complete